MALQIRMKVRVTYGGRSVDAIALHDTGAETYAFLDESIATQLGLTKGEAIGYSGIAGSSIGFKSEVSRVSLLDNADCSLDKVPVIVGQVSVPNVQLLIGEYFMRSVGMSTEVTEDGVKISCKKGVKVAMTQPIPTEYWVIGGAIVASVAVLAIFLKD
jgi:hypothetical protein